METCILVRGHGKIDAKNFKETIDLELQWATEKMLPGSENSKVLSFPSPYITTLHPVSPTARNQQESSWQGNLGNVFHRAPGPASQNKYKMVGLKLKPQVNSQYNLISIFSLLGFQFLD